MSESISLHKRPIAIASAVALLHVGGLAALQSGLLVRAYELVVPVEMISQIIEPPKPLPPIPPLVPPPPTPTSPPEPVRMNKAVVLPPAPQPRAIANPTLAPNAPIVTPAPPAPLPPITAPVAAAPSPAPATPPAPPPAPPAPPAKVELPRSDADHLNNPVPPYPPVSKRLGEEGTAVVRIFVGADGLPQKAELRTSSGHERLDSAALAAVMKWRFKPGTRGGVAEPMWILQPIPFVLNR